MTLYAVNKKICKIHLGIRHLNEYMNTASYNRIMECFSSYYIYLNIRQSVSQKKEITQAITVICFHSVMTFFVLLLYNVKVQVESDYQDIPGLMSILLGIICPGGA